MITRVFASLMVFALGALALAGSAHAQATPGAGPTAFMLDQQAQAYRLSPDGTMLAGANGDRQLCTYAVPSGKEIACATDDIQFDEQSISWAPDSSGFLFAQPAFTLLVDSDISSFDAKTGKITDLTDDGVDGPLDTSDQAKPVNVDIAPVASPDGTTVAFSRTTFAKGAFGGGRNDLMLLDLATGKADVLHEIDPDEPGVLYGGIVWSPDGGTIYATVNHADITNAENGIYAVDVSSGSAKRLTSANKAFGGDSGAALAISPDGKTLIVGYPLFQAQQTGGLANAFATLDIASKKLTVVEAPASDSGTPTAALMPAFTPDGHGLVYVMRSVETPPGVVMLRDLGSGRDTQIAELPESAIPIDIWTFRTESIGSNGVMFVPTDRNGGYLVQIGGASSPDSGSGNSGHPGSQAPTPGT